MIVKRSPYIKNLLIGIGDCVIMITFLSFPFIYSNQDRHEYY